MNPNELSQIIKSRRAVYHKFYTGEKVPHEVIMEMLENANWAPTHRHTEPWRFVVFEGDGLKKLADFQAMRYKKAATKEGNFDETMFEKLKSKPLLCSHMIAIGMRRDPKRSVPEVEELASVACAVQNMWLTASVNGAGCYWSTGGVTYDEGAKAFFGLDEADKLMGFMNIGMPDERTLISRRKPVEEKITWISG